MKSINSLRYKFLLYLILIVLLPLNGNAYSFKLTDIGSNIVDTINVKNFGAIGDGNTDDTQAFVLAMSESKEDHVVLYIPDGTYLLSSKIDILRGNIKIKGADNSVLKFTNENCKLDNRGYSYCDLGIHIGKDISDVVIDGVTVLGQTTNTIISYAITVWDFSNNITITNCTLSGFTGGILFNRQNRDLICEKNKFKNMTFVPAVTAGGYGIVFQSSINTIVRGNIFENSVYRHAMYYARNQKFPEEYGFKHKFYGNTVYGSVQKNYLTGYELSFKVMGNSDLEIENNTFIGGIGHIWLVKNNTGVNRDPLNVIIKFNIFKNIKLNNLSSHVYAIGVDDLAKTDGLNISNNTFENNYVSSLIKLQFGENMKINNNVINNINLGHFLFIEHSVADFQLINNKVQGMNNNSYGVIIGDSKSMTATKMTINNNLISGCEIGLLIRTAFSGDIQNNIIYAKSGGISLSQEKFNGNILGNKFYQSKWAIRNNNRQSKMSYSKNFFNDKEM